MRGFPIFMDFSPKKYVLINIHEYANEMICIFNNKLKGNVLALNGYQLCQFMLNIGLDMNSLLCVLSKFLYYGLPWKL